MTQNLNNYNELTKLIEKSFFVNASLTILDWDSSVMMPKDSIFIRKHMVSSLTSLEQEILQDKKISLLIAKAQDEINNLTNINEKDYKQRNLSLIKKKHTESTIIPNELTSEFSRICAETINVWEKCKPINDFKTYSIIQDKLFALVKEKAKIKSDYYQKSPYDCLLDQYEASTTTKEIDNIFTPFIQELQKILPHILEQNSIDSSTPLPKIPITKQQELCKKILDIIGFDFSNGRFDVSSHPFTGGTFGDTRITTRYNETDFLSGIYATVHEAGHALYQQNLPYDNYTQPIADALGMTIHESQSLFIERQICQSTSFIKLLYSLLENSCKDYIADFSYNDLYKHIRHIKANNIRVDADQVTYPFHIQIRYDIEKMLIYDNLSCQDIANIWNEKYKSYLDVEIAEQDYQNGCMQDIHWSCGSVGYFPCYLLGALTAAQIFIPFSNETSTYNTDITEKNFKNITNWLKTNIHQQGSRLSANQLIQKITDKNLDYLPLINYLKQTYLD